MQQQSASQCAIQQKKVTQDWHFLTPNLTEGGSSRLIRLSDHSNSCLQQQATVAPHARGIDLPTDDKCSGKALSFPVGHESPCLPPPKPTTKRSQHNNHLSRKHSLSSFHSPTQHHMASLENPFCSINKDQPRQVGSQVAQDKPRK